MPTAHGTLDWCPLTAHLDLVAPAVAAVASRVPQALVAAIDPGLADTAAFCAAYGVALKASANCVIVAGRRGGATTHAAVMVLATDRADINGVVRRHLDVRKISFAPMAETVALTGMEYGGITPVGLPHDWPVLVDAGVVAAGPVVIGSGLRSSKLLIDGADLAALGGIVLPLTLPLR